MTNITAIEQNGTLVVDSRLIAKELGIEHESFFKTIIKHLAKIEESSGVVALKTDKPLKSSTGGRPKKFAYLTEQQLKAALVRSRGKLSDEAIQVLSGYGWSLTEFSKFLVKRIKAKESDYSNSLHSLLGGKREAPTLAGAIDLLTTTEVIEVKAVNSWKAALGQVLVYGDYYPSHKKRIHLYGETQESFLQLIRKHCEKRSVVVTWEP